VLSTLVLALLAPGYALADGGSKGVTVSPLAPASDETITVDGELLGPNSEVEVLVIGNGETVDLGEVQANEEGDFTQEFRLPADLEPGTYEVEATGEESATTQITVSGAGGGSEGAGAMGEEPVIETRPLVQSILLVAVFGVLAAGGLVLARSGTKRTHKEA
jgi:hypothetical protein